MGIDIGREEGRAEKGAMLLPLHLLMVVAACCCRCCCFCGWQRHVLVGMTKRNRRTAIFSSAATMREAKSAERRKSLLRGRKKERAE
jgi:hypothetical protein